MKLTLPKVMSFLLVIFYLGTAPLIIIVGRGALESVGFNVASKVRVDEEWRLEIARRQTGNLVVALSQFYIFFSGIAWLAMLFVVSAYYGRARGTAELFSRFFYATGYEATMGGVFMLLTDIFRSQPARYWLLPITLIGCGLLMIVQRAIVRGRMQRKLSDISHQPSA